MGNLIKREIRQSNGNLFMRSVELVNSEGENDYAGRSAPSSGYRISRQSVVDDSFKKFWTTKSRHVDAAVNGDFWPWESSRIEDSSSRVRERAVTRESTQQIASALGKFKNDSKLKKDDKNPQHMREATAKSPSGRLLNIVSAERTGEGLNRRDRIMAGTSTVAVCLGGQIMRTCGGRGARGPARTRGCNEPRSWRHQRSRPATRCSCHMEYAGSGRCRHRRQLMRRPTVTL